MTRPLPKPTTNTEQALVGCKVPKSVAFTETLPRTPSGKILTKDLRAPYWAGSGRRIG